MGGVFKRHWYPTGNVDGQQIGNEEQARDRGPAAGKQVTNGDLEAIGASHVAERCGESVVEVQLRKDQKSTCSHGHHGLCYLTTCKYMVLIGITILNIKFKHANDVCTATTWPIKHMHAYFSIAGERASDAVRRWLPVL